MTDNYNGNNKDDDDIHMSSNPPSVSGHRSHGRDTGTIGSNHDTACTAQQQPNTSISTQTSVLPSSISVSYQTFRSPEVASGIISIPHSTNSGQDVSKGRDMNPGETTPFNPLLSALDPTTFLSGIGLSEPLRPKWVETSFNELCEEMAQKSKASLGLKITRWQCRDCYHV